MSPNPLQQILTHSQRVFTTDDIQHAVDTMAAAINADFAQQPVVLLCVLKGAIPFTAALMQKLSMPVEVDYIHASRYGKALTGGELVWLAKPQTQLQGRMVLVVDDIFDEGHTLQSIVEYCRSQQALQVKTAVLVNKHHQRKVKNFTVDYVGLGVADEYVFGFGMDCEGWGRNLNEIYALQQNEK